MTAGRWEGFATDALHLVVLANFAVAQPLYSVLGRNAEFFVARRTEPSDLLLLVLALSVWLPAIGVLIEWVAGLVAVPVRRAVHALLVAACLTALLLQPLRDTEVLPGDMLLVDAALAGAALTAVYLRWRPARMVASALAPAPIVFAALFLASGPVSAIAFPDRPGALDRPEAGRPHPIVLVVFDEFNSTLLMDADRRIDRDRFPNLAALAADGIWFRNATTVSNSTVQAVPAILTGKRPDPSADTLPTLGSFPDNLFTLLLPQYTVVAYEPVTRLCPEPRCTREPVEGGVPGALTALMADLGVVYLHIVLPADLRRHLPSTEAAWKGFAVAAANDPAAAFRQFLAAITPGDRPVLYFLHSLLPHVPWRYLPSGSHYASHREAMAMEGWTLAGVDRWGPDEWAVAQGMQRHLLQLGFVDRLIGELRARLEAVGLYDESLVVVTADHGLTFQPGRPRRDVSGTRVSDVAAVPLIVKLPGRRAEVIRDDNVETVDILPTIADVVDLHIPWAIDGRSLLGPPRSPGEPKRIVWARARRTVEVPAGLDDRGSTLAMLHRWFGPAIDPDGLHTGGAERALLGRPVAAVEARAPDGRFRVTMASPDGSAGEGRPSGFVPVHVKGEIAAESEPRGSLTLAVSVDGVIRALTRTHAWDGRAAPFSAMLPEAALAGGRKRVEVLLVSTRDSGPTLQRLAPGGSPETGRVR